MISTVRRIKLDLGDPDLATRKTNVATRGGGDTDEKESKVKFGRWNFDLTRRTLVSTSDNQEIRLTTLEFQLLEVFLLQM